jgi:hypothetical protein
VVGPKAVPVVRDADVALRDPELAVLSAMAHGKDAPDVAISIATVALAACRHLDDERAMLYFDLINISLGDAARAAFEDLMGQGTYQFQSDFAKKHRAAGQAEGKAASVLQVLEARGIVVAAEQRARVLGCTDMTVLDRWIRRAVTVTTAEELFSD